MPRTRTPSLGVALCIAFALVAGLSGCHRDAEPPRPNILLISIDTLRADRLGTYDPSRSLSPSIDALAREAAVLEHAITQAPWTTPSHMSLFTSLHPSSHGVNQGWSEFMAFSRGEAGYRVLPETVAMLPEILHDAGYRTLALTGGGTVGGALGFDRGFETYRDDARKLRPEHWTQLVDWLANEDDDRDDDRDDERPFFLFLHTFEVHAPYTHIDEARSLLDGEQAAALEAFMADRELSEADLKRYLKEHDLYRLEITEALYDGGVRFTDAFLGDLFDLLKDNGLWDDTIIVLLSDHGEEFAEHRPDKIYNVHCDGLWNEYVHVPLILRVPGRYDDGRRIGGLSRLIDVAPTLLDLLELEIPASHQGESLLPRLDGAPPPERRPVFSESPCIGPERKALRTDRYTYLATFELPKGADRTGIPGVPLEELLYDRSVDPGEQKNLASTEVELRDRMRRRLARFFTEEVKPIDGAGSITMDQELEEQLRALGYID